MKNEPDAADMFVEQFMVGVTDHQLVKIRIRMMIQHSSTNRERLAKALIVIGQSFRGDNEKIEEAVGRLYKGFVNRLPKEE